MDAEHRTDHFMVSSNIQLRPLGTSEEGRSEARFTSRFTLSTQSSRPSRGGDRNGQR